MHPLPVLSTVLVDVLRGVPCPGHVLFAVTDDGKCRRKHLKGERCNEQPRITCLSLAKKHEERRTLSVEDMVRPF